MTALEEERSGSHNGVAWCELRLPFAGAPGNAGGDDAAQQPGDELVLGRPQSYRGRPGSTHDGLTQREAGAVRNFVWSKVEAEAGEGITGIVRRKETERLAGDGVFWWGVGNSLGPALHDAAAEEGGELPLVFSRMLSRPKAVDVDPGEVWVWTHFEDRRGGVHPVPEHVVVTSRGGEGKSLHYALVCVLDDPLGEGQKEPFDPTLCRTRNGKVPGPSQVTAVLRGDFEGHTAGAYVIDMAAWLVFPYQMRLVRHRALEPAERLELATWSSGSTQQWLELARRLKHLEVVPA